MCALPQATVVTTVYQRDSSSKRPRPSVVFAARTWDVRQRTRRPGLRALQAAPSAPLDPVLAVWRGRSYAAKLTLVGRCQVTIENEGAW